MRLPGEPKPTYLDVESSVLGRIVCREIRQCADGAEQFVAVSEMLPGPGDCWLELDGERYTSELRLAAVDLTRRGHCGVGDRASSKAPCRSSRRRHPSSILA